MLKLTGQETRAQQVIDRCLRLATFSEDPSGICRTFLSPAMRDCYREVQAWMESAGMRVRVDGAGNLRGVYPAASGSNARVVVGSHLDTVPGAGAYDGILGVVLPVTLIESLQGERLPFAIEVIGFSEEEGVRFGVPFIGSRALAGRLDEELLNRQDANGTSVRQAIQSFGLDDREIPELALIPEALAFLEFHIEQGPVLEEAHLPLGVVEAIAGQNRIKITFSGRSSHAGTTPMRGRRDALAAAAEWAVAVERHACGVEGLVATVGRLEINPGAANVIAGEAAATLDIRHASDSRRKQSVNTLLEAAQQIGQSRGVRVQTKMLLEQSAVKMSSPLVEHIEAALNDSGVSPLRMVSGAGHDAMIIAERVPAAMIFLRSPGGISHNPEETVLLEDVSKAIECGGNLLHRLASFSEFHTGTHRA